MSIANRCTRVFGVAATTVALASCGGGGGGATATGAQACSPNNPYRGDATAQTRVGSLTAEKAWLRFIRRNPQRGQPVLRQRLPPNPGPPAAIHQ